MPRTTWPIILAATVRSKRSIAECAGKGSGSIVSFRHPTKTKPSTLHYAVHPSCVHFLRLLDHQIHLMSSELSPRLTGLKSFLGPALGWLAAVHISRLSNHPAQTLCSRALLRNGSLLHALQDTLFGYLAAQRLLERLIEELHRTICTRQVHTAADCLVKNRGRNTYESSCMHLARSEPRHMV